MVLSISCTLPPFHIISVYIFINYMCTGMCFTHQPLWHGITLTRPLRHLESYVGSKPIFTSSCWSIKPISPLPSNSSLCSPYPILSSFTPFTWHSWMQLFYFKFYFNQSFMIVPNAEPLLITFLRVVLVLSLKHGKERRVHLFFHYWLSHQNRWLKPKESLKP